MTRLYGHILTWVLSVAFAAEAFAQPSGVGIPPFPGSEVHEMGGLTLVNGKEVRAYYFTTKVPPEQVAKYYKKKWRESGQFVSVHKTSRSGLAVGYVDFGTGETRTVSFWRDGSLTYGFPAVVKGVALPAASSSAVVGEVPVHPYAEGLMTYESLERGGIFRTISYSNKASLRHNESFFLREMGTRGWHLMGRHEGKQDEKSVMLDFAKKNKKMAVTLAWVPEHHSCSVFIVTNFGVHRQKEGR